MRHVIYVCTDPGVPAYGRKGCSVHVQEVLRQLVARADRVDLVVARLGGPVPTGLEGVVTHELGRPTAHGAAEAERALRDLDLVAAGVVRTLIDGALDLDRDDVLVYQRYSLWSCDTLETARDAGARTVLEINAPLVDEQAQHRVLVDRATAETCTRRVLRAADVAYAVSEPVAAWARSMAAVPVAVEANGVDPSRFAWPRPPRPATAPFTIGFVGTFRPWHGLELLVDAAASLARSQTDRPPRLLLVGDGPTRDAVLARAATAGVAVEHTGAVDPAEIPALLARCDVAAAPYPVGDAYFSPLKVMEYLAAGLPTVAAAVGDLPALVRDGDETLLVPPGDHSALAAALRRLRDQPALREHLSTGARRAAVERLSWDGVITRVVDRLPREVAA